MTYKITDSLKLLGFTIKGHRWLNNGHVMVRDDFVDIPKMIAEEHYTGQSWALAGHTPLSGSSLDEATRWLENDYPTQLLREATKIDQINNRIAFMVGGEPKQCVCVNPNYLEVFSDYYPHSFWVNDPDQTGKKPIAVKNVEGEIVGVIMPLLATIPIDLIIVKTLCEVGGL